MPLIELRDVAKRFGPTTVIEGLNLTMEPEEFTVLVGPSGCGKSTTLRMIAGLEDVSGGEILIDGRDVSGLEPKDRGLAMVFQDYALYPHMSVAKNMSFALRLARTPKPEIDKRVNEAAELLGLTPYLNRKPAQLSGGQRQRVAMGRVLVRDADAFLFDEPLSNLDAKLRNTMRTELALLRQRVQKNMIYVTHDQIEAMTLGDRIVVMRDGAIMQAGTPEELYKRPANRFVAGFIGSPPMNVFAARVSNGALDASGTTLGLAPSVSLVDGTRIDVGVRPTELTPGREGSSNVVRGIVSVSEYVGSRAVLHVDTALGALVLDWDAAHRVRVGETVPVLVPADALYVFDAASGATLVQGAAGNPNMALAS